LIEVFIKDKQIPEIEAVLKAKESSTKLRVAPINVLVLCPTRELAIQLTEEAKVLLRYCYFTLNSLICDSGR
jgi:superfamily II DNA/RNA helicase